MTKSKAYLWLAPARPRLPSCSSKVEEHRRPGAALLSRDTDTPPIVSIGAQEAFTGFLGPPWGLWRTLAFVCKTGPAGLCPQDSFSGETPPQKPPWGCWGPACLMVARPARCSARFPRFWTKIIPLWGGLVEGLPNLTHSPKCDRPLAMLLLGSPWKI